MEMELLAGLMLAVRVSGRISLLLTENTTLRYFTDPGFAGSIIGSIIGAVATILVFLARPRDEDARQKERAILFVGNYLRAITAALTGMIEDFENRRVPHESGRRFRHLISDILEVQLRPLLGDQTAKVMESVKDLAIRADSIDAEIYGNQFSAETIRNWIIDAQRLKGDLTAVADILSPQ